MKLTKILTAFALTLIVFTSCKKDNGTEDTPGTVTVNPDGSLNLSDADGALYAIQIRNYDTYNGTGYDASQMAYAWFGKFPTVVDAGIVKANSTELGNMFNYYTEMALLSFGDTLFTGTNANVVWNVQGKTTSGVPAFIHTDNSALPTSPAFTLPASININNSLTVSHTPVSANLGVLYTITGNKGDSTKFVASNSSSISFSSAELKAVAYSNDQIGLSIMPVSYTTATYGGKKYYFVKQHQFTRETVTL